VPSLEKFADATASGSFIFETISRVNKKNFIQVTSFGFCLIRNKKLMHRKYTKVENQRHFSGKLNLKMFILPIQLVQNNRFVKFLLTNK
jgi:hypothetical protein